MNFFKGVLLFYSNRSANSPPFPFQKMSSFFKQKFLNNPNFSSYLRNVTISVAFYAKFAIFDGEKKSKSESARLSILVQLASKHQKAQALSA